MCSPKGELLPNPTTDPIACVTYCVRDDDRVQAAGASYKDDVGVILVRGVVPENALGEPRLPSLRKRFDGYSCRFGECAF